MDMPLTIGDVVALVQKWKEEGRDPDQVVEFVFAQEPTHVEEELAAELGKLPILWMVLGELDGPHDGHHSLVGTWVQVPQDFKDSLEQEKERTR